MKEPRVTICFSLVVLLWATALGAWGSKDDLDNGTPYGEPTDKDTRALYTFANAQGVDLEAAYARAEKGDRAGLEQIFALSTRFMSLNRPARMYGNLVYACLLNLVEERGEEYFAGALESQSPSAQQRVRDFLLYPLTRLPKKERDRQLNQVHDDLPRIFPRTHVFGENDPLFG